MIRQFDIVVVGAGPAGMSAAIEAAEGGAKVCILDEQKTAGGQIYRNVMNVGEEQAKVLGGDYLLGGRIVDRFMRCGAVHETGVTVWQITKDGTVVFSRDGQATRLCARHIVLATGAMERAVPIPGWTKPGVMTVGASQILLKSGGLVPKDAVLVGSGPLLYLVAVQLLAAGAKPKALVETQTLDDFIKSMRHIAGALKGWRQLVKGIGFIAKLTMARVPRFTACSEVTIEGEDCASAVSFKSGKRQHRIETDTVLLHQGVVPNTQISRSLDLDHHYDNTQRCFYPAHDDYGQSSNPMFSIAGDGAGIGGAYAAVYSGRLAALNALTQVGLLSKAERDAKAPKYLKQQQYHLAIRPFLDTAYPPPEEVLKPAADTIICRCEEVTAGDIRRYASLGCLGPNQTKSFGRSGMGPCQGRFCGLTVTELLAEATGRSQEAVGSYRIRAPLKPITLAELASLDTEI